MELNLLRLSLRFYRETPTNSEGRRWGRRGRIFERGRQKRSEWGLYLSNHGESSGGFLSTVLFPTIVVYYFILKIHTVECDFFFENLQG